MPRSLGSVWGLTHLGDNLVKGHEISEMLQTVSMCGCRWILWGTGYLTANRLVITRVKGWVGRGRAVALLPPGGCVSNGPLSRSRIMCRKVLQTCI
ncbi:hypothetical protein DUNSADRAFT_4634 [Dunaliella salina]|uniref:Uncharacterized protein n=1 Tax=Dunaliella salina TaxID=3046 RepID=A0ABQ7GRN7_DUNSA|nr:hypothetical protein DUNSADRAFT_4634 [Dunaliella salina]|eukprot:KAF5837243.1 hypothetical protein DUNSADRAFT_4634 [Dunaliella salina]